MDGSRLKAMGWAPKVELQRGLEEVYAWYLDKSGVEIRK
jgi:hypothetical protein